ncbi:MAG: sulfite exporter TauE/SafE family protein, partial [Ramlibacter sp.]|nr:sulfite exporter TauE/SafE family protein [Ramlibacter sp.]
AFTDLPMKAVVATTMGVLALVSAGGVFNASVAGQVPWAVALPFAAGAVTGLLAGRLFAGHLSGPRLQQGFAVLSLLIAAGMLVHVGWSANRALF